jgi:hypothetical protein
MQRRLHAQRAAALLLQAAGEDPNVRIYDFIYNEWFGQSIKCIKPE